MVELNLQNLEKGLPGLSVRWCYFLSEAGAYCLNRAKHESGVVLKIDSKKFDKAKLIWNNVINEQIKRSWNDDREATEFGACCLAILLTLNLTEFTIIERSYIGTGFDYYLGYKNIIPFENAAKLEISGIQEGSIRQIKRRFKEKIKQTEKFNNTKLPVYISIIEFSEPYAIYNLINERN